MRVVSVRFGSARFVPNRFVSIDTVRFRSVCSVSFLFCSVPFLCLVLRYIVVRRGAMRRDLFRYVVNPGGGRRGGGREGGGRPFQGFNIRFHVFSVVLLSSKGADIFSSLAGFLGRLIVPMWLFSVCTLFRFGEFVPRFGIIFGGAPAFRYNIRWRSCLPNSESEGSEHGFSGVT